MLIASVGCMAYPLINNYVNSLTKSYTFNVYEKIVAEQVDYSSEYKRCVEYNKRLANRADRMNPTDSDIEEYYSLLNFGDDAMMGYVDVPKINIKQPILHGTDVKELAYGAGHVIGTSLPVGGLGTHSVLAGHTGMSSQMMFTDLTEMEIGDKFYIHVLGQIITYEVDQIELVLPTDMSLIKIEPDKDYVTLVTCYPLGVGSHRLLVRGHNTGQTSDQAQDEISTTQKVVTKTDKINWSFMLLALLVIIYFIYSGHKRKKKKKQKKAKTKKRQTFDIVKDDNYTSIIYENREDEKSQ